jgi:dihydroorotate dehydrogenase
MDSDRGNIVNFTSFRKTRREEEKRTAIKRKDDLAAANRVKFGRTGAEKKRKKLEDERRRRELEGKEMDAGKNEPSRDPDQD